MGDLMRIDRQMNALAYGTEMSYVLPSVELPDGAMPEELLGRAYEQLDLDETLHRYAFDYHRSAEDSRPVGDTDVLGALHTYNGFISLVSMQGDNPDVAVIRGGFDRVYDSMDAAIEAKMHPPKSAFQRLLARAGVSQHETPRHIVRLNEHFWMVQFPDMLAGEAQAQRQPEDTDAIYLWRVLDECMRGFIFSHFSYTQQARRLA